MRSLYGAKVWNASVPELISFWFPLAVFLSYILVAWYLLVFVFGAERWFLNDDWFILSGRDGTSLRSIFEPHNEHLVALPVILYRILFSAFGLEFTPYWMMVVTTHMAVAATLWIMMYRYHVEGWIATAAASAFVLSSSGDLLWAFQVSFLASILFGLIQMLLADHSGPIGRRDCVALLAGGAALLSAGVAVPLIMGTGIATLVKRGWAPALLQTVPLGALYVLWFLIVAPSTPIEVVGRPTLPVMLEWAHIGVRSTLVSLAHYHWAAVALGAVLVVGTALAGRSEGWQSAARRLAVPLALLVCAPIFFVLISQGRWISGIETVGTSRYMYCGAVFLLVALGVAANAIGTRWRLLTPLLCLLFVVGIPGNVNGFGSGFFGPAHFETQRQLILGLAHAPEAESVPEWVRPLPKWWMGPHLTVGWLLETRRDGRVPEPRHIDDRIRRQFPLRLGLVHTNDSESIDGRVHDCIERTEPVIIAPAVGEQFRIHDPINVALIDDEGNATWPVQFDPADGTGLLSVVLPDLHLRFAPLGDSDSFVLCQ